MKTICSFISFESSKNFAYNIIVACCHSQKKKTTVILTLTCLQITSDVILLKIYYLKFPEFNKNMSKRVYKMVTETSSTKKPKHWSLGLLDSMNNPETIVKKTDNLVVIHDKYPKAKIHYLVLPEDNINSIYKLNSSHVSLLEEFGEFYEEIKAEHKGHSLQAGFHAVPSMQRLHMHIISTDMISPCLKTKIHWNSFTTKFFLPYQGKSIVIAAYCIDIILSFNNLYYVIVWVVVAKYIELY